MLCKVIKKLNHRTPGEKNARHSGTEPAPGVFLKWKESVPDSKKALHKLAQDAVLNQHSPGRQAQDAAVDELVADKMLLENLYRRLDELIPDGAQVFRLRAQHYSEREIARMLGVKSQSTLNYRIRKMDEFIRAHRDELEDLLH